MSDNKEIQYDMLDDEFDYEAYFEERRLKREKERRKIQLIIMPIRVVLFPIMLIVRLFRWTYHYDD